MGALERFFTLAGEMGRFFAAFFLADCSDSTTLLPSRDCRQAQFTKHEVMEVKFEGSDGGFADPPFIPSIQRTTKRLKRAARIERALPSPDASGTNHARHFCHPHHFCRF